MHRSRSAWKVSRNAGQHHAGQSEVRMVEEVEELRCQTCSFTRSVERKPFGDVEVAPEEVRAAQRVAAEVSELAILRGVAAVAGSRAGSTADTNAFGLSH